MLAVTLAASPAGAIITWEASGGWNFGGSNSHGSLTQPPNPPALVTSGGDFSNGGAFCPPLGTPDYICGFYYGLAELVGTPPGGLVRMHAVARLRQEDATGAGFVKLVYGGARVWFIGVSYATVTSPVTQAVFNYHLHGVRSETGGGGSVTVEAKGVAFMVADKQYFIQCFADVCDPITVPISSNWDPGAPGGTAFYVDLRTDARITAPLGLVFDAAANADYRDTLELRSVELQDANGDPVPGARLVVRDGGGNVVYTIDATTTTTLPGATTTTTTTIAPGATTTTTAPGGATTTTTLPSACPAGASFASVRCRLDLLLAAVQGAAEGPIAVKLVNKVSAAQQSVATAEQLVAGSRAKAAKRLRKAQKALAAYGRVLKTRAGKRALDEATRTALAAPLAQLRADLQALRTPAP